MVISNERVVSLTYDLRIDSEEGKLVESVGEDNPLNFIYGAGQMLPKFEANLSNLAVGDSFKFELVATDGYGEFNEQAVVDVPVSIFEVDGKIDDNLVKVGNTIPMMDRSGNRLSGKVVEVGNENIKMDFNHPLAGNTLFFSGKVTEVREATDAELAQGLNQGCGSGCGCGSGESGGCGSGSCGSGCGCGSAEAEMQEQSSGCGCGSGENGGCC